MPIIDNFDYLNGLYGDITLQISRGSSSSHFSILRDDQVINLDSIVKQGVITYAIIGESFLCSGTFFYNQGRPLTEPDCLTDLSYVAKVDLTELRVVDLIPNINEVRRDYGDGSLIINYNIGDTSFVREVSSWYLNRVLNDLPVIDFDSDLHYSIRLNGFICTDTIKYLSAASYDSLIEEYPFLENFGVPNECTGETISIYEQGVHRYVNIETPTSSILYYQDGSKLCTGSPTFDCPAAYGFDAAALIEVFECTNVGGFIYNGQTISGIYTLDYLEYDICQFWPPRIIDARGSLDGCTDSGGAEVCLSGEIRITSDGSYSLGYSAVTDNGNGVSVSGGSSAGTFKVVEGLLLTVAYSDEFFPVPALVSDDRIEFDSQVEGCRIRVGGYRQ